MQTNVIGKERIIYSRFPTQAEIDAAYAVRVFLQHRPASSISLPALIWQSGVPEKRLKTAFEHEFQERLEEYWERMRLH
jgi:hypothetical protein